MDESSEKLIKEIKIQVEKCRGEIIMMKIRGMCTETPIEKTGKTAHKARIF